MPKFFYSDCTITNIQKKSQINLGTVEATALVNGREAKKIAISPELYDYFRGKGNNIQHRIWFITKSKKKPITVIAVKNAQGDISSTPTSAKNYVAAALSSLLFSAIIWAISWPFMPIFVDRRDQDSSALWIGFIVFLFLFVRGARVISKISNFRSWPQGSIDESTTKVKQLFEKDEKDHSSKGGWQNN
ncbi:hypothetical protein ACNFH5_15520 [Pseudomonas sp. NY15435]|uniref:hypothetical protein n=1 Tax=Pseudomonas sp. NY15435 TaxID=3400358 RepID=UPI003A8B14AB